MLPVIKAWSARPLVRALKKNGYTNIVTRSHRELDLTRQDQVERFFDEEAPDYVFLAAAKVGGIIANSRHLADFMYENMILEMNVIHEAWKHNCKKLMFLGSSCIYPKMAPQPDAGELPAHQFAGTNQRGICACKDFRAEIL